MSKPQTNQPKAKSVPRTQRTVENILNLADKVTDQLVTNKINLDHTSMHNFIDLCEQYHFAPDPLANYESKSQLLQPKNSKKSLYSILKSINF